MKLKIPSPEQFFTNIIVKVPKESKIAFFSAIIVGVLSHIYFFTNKFMNGDDVGRLYGNIDATASGRWFLGNVTTSIRSLYSLPTVIGILCILALASTSVLTVAMLDIKKTINIILVSALIMTFPSTAYTFSYLFTADGYMISLFLAALSIFISSKYKHGFWIGGVILGFSMGIYQSYVGYAMGMSVIILIVMVLKNKSTLKEILLKCITYLTTGIIGVTTYFIILKFSLSIKNTELYTYKGMSEMGQIPSDRLSELTLKTYKRFMGFFTGDTFFYVSNPIRFDYLVIFAMVIAFIATLVIRNKIYNKPFEISILAFLIIALPITLNIVDIIAPYSLSGPLTIYQVVLFFIFPIILLELLFQNINLLPQQKENNTAWYKNSVGHIISWIMIISLFFISFNFYLIDNTYYLKMTIVYERTFALANRVIYQIEQLPEYTPDTPVAIIGNLPNSNYPKSKIAFNEIQNDQGIPGDVIGFVTSDKNNTYRFAAFISNYLGINIKPATIKQQNDVKHNNEWKNIGVWPKKNSVVMIDGIAVVNLDYPLAIEIIKKSNTKYKFQCVNFEKLPMGTTYAWYIYKGSERIDLKWFTDSPFLEYDFTAPGEYSTVLFIKYDDINESTTSDIINIP